MAGLYVETSALGRILLAEPDAEAIRAILRAYDERLSSALLLVELRRLAISEGLTSIADRMLNGVQLLSVSAEVLDRASRVGPTELRSLVAIHLSAAIELHEARAIDAVLTYDRHLQLACLQHGVPVEPPVPHV